MRSTNTSRNASILAKRAAKSSKKAALTEICILMKAASDNNNNRLPYGYVTKLINETNDMAWLTRDTVNKAFIKFKKDLENSDDNCMEITLSSSQGSTISDLSTSFSAGTLLLDERKGPGRPKGSTIDSKRKQKEKGYVVKNLITKKFSSMKYQAKLDGKRCKPGTLEKIINKEKSKYNYVGKVCAKTIRNRVLNQKFHVTHSGGHKSPLCEIEATIVSIIIQMARIYQ